MTTKKPTPADLISMSVKVTGDTYGKLKALGVANRAAGKLELSKSQGIIAAAIDEYLKKHNGGKK